MKLKRFAVWKNWIVMHKKPLLISAGVLFIALGVLGFLGIFSSDPVERTELVDVVEEVQEAEKFYSPLTGKEVSEEHSKRPVTAVVIENSPDARPQSGLAQTGVTFEAIAEGGVTRFVVFYQEDQPELIGPVRSLRPYFNDWIRTYDASIAHVGGSATALAEIPQYDIKDLDQFFNPGYYWRTTDRYAPHNVYTDSSQLNAANSSKGFTVSKFEPLPRKDAQVNQQPKARQITINVSSHLYRVDYTYDKKTNTYARFMGGQPHMDREKGQIKPSVVVAMKVPNSIVDGFRYDYELVGSGEAFIFQDGNVAKVTWSRENRMSQFKFTNAAGNEVKLNRGQTWFTAIGPEKSVNWTP